VLTVIVPVEAPDGTCATICVAVHVGIIWADVPANATVPDVPKPVPVMVTLVPTAPDVGEMDVMVGTGVKFAVTLSFPLMVRFCGVVVPLRLPLNPEKTYPLAADALTCTTVPVFSAQPLEQDGLIVPAPDGLTAVVREYCGGVPIWA
jgi:hypothetical protein